MCCGRWTRPALVWPTRPIRWSCPALRPNCGSACSGRPRDVRPSLAAPAAVVVPALVVASAPPHCPGGELQRCEPPRDGEPPTLVGGTAAGAAGVGPGGPG